MKSNLNVRLNKREGVIIVKQVLQIGPDFMVILGDDEKKRKLIKSEADPRDWPRIQTGAEIKFVVKEEVDKWWIRPRPPAKFPDSFDWDQVPYHGFVTFCERCQEIHVYGSGDHPFETLIQMGEVHERTKPDCKGIELEQFHIYDDRGEEEIKGMKILKAIQRKKKAAVF